STPAAPCPCPWVSRPPCPCGRRRPFPCSSCPCPFRTNLSGIVRHPRGPASAEQGSARSLLAVSAPGHRPSSRPSSLPSSLPSSPLFPLPPSCPPFCPLGRRQCPPPARPFPPS